MAAERLIITNGRIVDPGAGIDEVGNLTISNGRIAAIGTTGAGDGGADGEAERRDAGGVVGWLGLNEMHFLRREPGKEEVETTDCGGAAAQ